MIDEILKNKKLEFRTEFESETTKIKKQLHYFSVINMIDAILTIKNKRVSKPYKENICNYIDTVINIDLPIDKLTSLELFNRYLFSTSKYLMYKSDFTSNTDFQRTIIFGILIDLIFSWILITNLGFYFPIFSIILTYKGYKKKKKNIKDKKYFNVNY